jgi:hypothetical protein
LIEVILPEGYLNVFKEIFQKVDITDFWEKTLDDSRLLVKILVPTENTENILDLVEKRLAHMEGFRIILLPVEASQPWPKQEEKKQTAGSEISGGEKRVSQWIRSAEKSPIRILKKR